MIKNSFTWLDYGVFGCMLAISLAIGIVFGIKNRKQKSTQISKFIYFFNLFDSSI